MELRAVVKFRDRWEAAAWLARYYLHAGAAPELATALRAVFPYQGAGAGPFPGEGGAGIWGQVIEAEALRVLGLRAAELAAELGADAIPAAS